jgi:hypothetical protein
MATLKHSFFAFLLLSCGLALSVPQLEELGSPVAHIAPKKVNGRVMAAAIKARADRFEKQKYIQAGIVGVGAVGAILLWRSMRAKSESASAGSVNALVIPDGSSSPSSAQSAQESFSLKKYFSNAAHNTWAMLVTVFASTLAYTLKDTVFSSGFSFLGKLWRGTDNCRLLYVLSQGALNSFDGLLRRRAEGFTSSDGVVMARYNNIISSLERYVVELSAHTIYLSQKRGVPCDGLFPLLEQFIGDVAAVASRLDTLEEPLAIEDARSRTLCSMILQTIRHIEELHTKLSIDFDQQAVEPHREHDFS